MKDTNNQSERTGIADFTDMIKLVEELSGHKIDEFQLQNDLKNYDQKAELQKAAIEANKELEAKKQKQVSEWVDITYKNKKGVLNQKWTFKNIIVDPQNHDAVMEAINFSNLILQHPSASAVLIISGGVGSGKTVLVNAIANAWIEKANLDVELVTFDDIKGLCLFNSNEETDERIQKSRDYEKYAWSKLLIIENIASEGGLKIYEQKFLGKILRERASNNLPTVVTTPMQVNDLHMALGDFCFDSLKEFELAKACVLWGASRRRGINLAGCIVN